MPEGTWAAFDSALRNGLRGLPKGLSLARLLARQRGVKNKAERPTLTVRQILTYAAEHHARTASWPTATSGPIPGSRGDTWAAIDQTLRKGRRGLPGDDSLPRLLRRGKR